MDRSFWTARWAENKVGFHEGTTNRFLTAHVARLGEGTRVLVPLCGKTFDLPFLAARGHAVVGVEIVEEAVQAFFVEQSLTPTIERRGEHVMYTAGLITILAGDMLTVTPELVGTFDALYDRAALIALPADVRPRYVAKLRTLFPAHSPALVITLEYAQEQMAGPPFAVLEAELRGYFPAAELLEEAPDGRVRVPPVAMLERCWAVTT